MDGRRDGWKDGLREGSSTPSNLPSLPHPTGDREPVFPPSWVTQIHSLLMSDLSVCYPRGPAPRSVGLAGPSHHRRWAQSPSVPATRPEPESHQPQLWGYRAERVGVTVCVCVGGEETACVYGTVCVWERGCVFVCVLGRACVYRCECWYVCTCKRGCVCAGEIACVIVCLGEHETHRL